VGGILQLIEPFEKDGTLVKREPHRDRARHRQLHHHRARRRDLRLRRALPLPRGKHGRDGGLTVSPQSQGQGDGEKLLKRIEQRARAMGWTASSC
jgi:amino-acid N-acetyltransferase